MAATQAYVSPCCVNLNGPLCRELKEAIDVAGSFLHDHGMVMSKIAIPGVTVHSDDPEAALLACCVVNLMNYPTPYDQAGDPN